MALKSTIFKASLQIADIDHGYYADHTLTLTLTLAQARAWAWAWAWAS